MPLKSMILTLTIVIFSVALAFAVPAGRQLEFTKSAMGKVTFDGKLHNAVAKGCTECHNKDTFPKMKQGTVEIKMGAIYAGKLCGICHNGERAFSAKGNCTKCHKR
ncbi:MAG: cytochrome c3 family protein [Desulfuromonadales bacterium]|nr:cytochrome c3 family protein [Desulfuromonadales bacterium]